MPTLPPPRHIRFYLDIVSQEDTFKNNISIEFQLDNDIIPGVYTAASGLLKNFRASLNRKTGLTYATGLAEYNPAHGDHFNITIDSIYKQQDLCLLFGTLEGTLTRYNSQEKIQLTKGRFGYDRL